MNDNLSRRKKSRRKKSGGSKVLLICLIAGAAFVFLVAAGVGMYFAFGKSKVNPLTGTPLELPNSKVTVENYEVVKVGDTLAQVEAVMGGGRPAVAADFDIAFPEEGAAGAVLVAARKNRAAWVANNERGLVRVWSNGPKRLIVTFSQPAESVGRLVSKMFINGDGMVMTESGTAPLINPQPAANPNMLTQPTEPDTRVANLDVEILLAKYNADPAAAAKRYQGRKVTVTGTAKQVQKNLVLIQAEGVTLQAAITGPPITQKKAGDTVVITGTVRNFFTNSHMLMMDGCTLDN